MVRLAGGVQSPAGLWPALGASLLTATISTALIALLGTPLAYLLARSRGVPARILTALVALPLALPALMSGLLLLYVVGPYTAAGELFGGGLTESRVGIVLAQTFVAAPFLVIAARAAFASVDPALEDVAATLGHGRLARFMRVAVPAALPGIVAGLLLAWLRAFGEFGATLILAYHPYSLPVFTWVQFDATGLPATMLPIAIALAAALVVIVLAGLRIPRRRSRPAAPRPPVPAPPDAASGLSFELGRRVGSFRLDVAHDGQSRRLAILGPSGAGKTMTLRMLAGLDRGEGRSRVSAGGEELGSQPPERRGLGYVPQQGSLLPRRTLWRQATFAVGCTPEVAAWWLSRLGLQGLEDRYPEELSGGQQRRGAIARALAAQPRVLLLDEPFAGLDAPVRAALRRELRSLQRESGLATVIVTHDPEDAAALAEEIVLIDSGRVLQAGPREEVFARPVTPRAAALLGVGNVNPGVVAADGLVTCGGAEVVAPTAGLRPGEKVLWRIAPERIEVGAGALKARIEDEIELPAGRELSLRLGEEGPLLLARTSGGEIVDGAAGERVRVALPEGAITVWAAAAADARSPG